MMKISTHTLTWSVTTLCWNCKHAVPISTHTLTWSVTETLYDETDWEEDFNSHAHVERDIDEFEGEQAYEISTHTLTWSVTNTTNISY